MQKVEGSSPFIRFNRCAVVPVVLVLVSAAGTIAAGSPTQLRARLAAARADSSASGRVFELPFSGPCASGKTPHVLGAVAQVTVPASWHTVRVPAYGCEQPYLLTDRRGESALIAVQGPRSVDVLAPLVEAGIADLKYYTCVETKAGDAAAVVARTGYTGEDGFEIFLPADAAAGLWDVLLGGHRGVAAPCGLGARDVLRLEAGMPLYGHELTEEITPLQAGLDWVVKLDKPDFLGEAALAAQKSADDYPRIVGIVMDGRAPAREGYHVFLGEKRVGEIRSGSIGPSVGNKSIGTALLEKEAATPGTDVVVHIRGTAYGAKVVQLPFYKRSYKIGAA